MSGVAHVGVMTLHRAKGKPNRRFFLGLAGLALALGGCSTFEGAPLLPTGGVRSAETTRPAEYPAVGVVPPQPAPNLSPADRERLRSDLAAAREGNRAAASVPLDQPLPPNPPTTPTQPTAPAQPGTQTQPQPRQLQPRQQQQQPQQQQQQ